MRFARKLLLLAVAAGAVMAMTAPAASALEIKNEVTGVHCSAVTTPGNGHGVGSGGCVLHATSVGKVELGTIAGMILCDNEFEGRVNEAGVGFIYAATLSNCDGSVVECREAGVLDNWPAQLNAENSMEATFCVTAFGFINVSCNLEGISVVQNPAEHSDVDFTTGATHKACDAGGNTLQGSWEAEVDASHPEIEIVG